MERQREQSKATSGKLANTEKELAVQTTRATAAEAQARAADEERERTVQKHASDLQRLREQAEGNERHLLSRIEEQKAQIQRVLQDRERESAAAAIMAGTLVRKYRRYSAAERQAIVAECEAPGASVAKIARSHDLNANQVFRWRKQLRGVAGGSEPQWLAVMPTESAQPKAGGCDQLELILASGHRVRITGAVDLTALESCLRRLLP